MSQNHTHGHLSLAYSEKHGGGLGKLILVKFVR